MDASSDTLTRAQLTELRAALEAKRAELRQAIATYGRPIDDAEKPVEDGDLAERDIEETSSAQLAEHKHRLLDEVERAMARMTAGSYGRSELSGDPIPYARLKAVPWARTNSDEV